MSKDVFEGNPDEAATLHDEALSEQQIGDVYMKECPVPKNMPALEEVKPFSLPGWSWSWLSDDGR
jgi:hypothetical protein